MRNIAQFTTADGRRIGIPVLGGLIVLDAVLSPLENQPEGAQSLVRYIIAGGEGARFAWLRDPFKHVISKLPQSACGPWAHATDAMGNNVVFPAGAIGAFEEKDDETIDVSLAIPTGPVDIRLRGTLETLTEISGYEQPHEEPPAQAEPAASEE